MTSAEPGEPPLAVYLGAAGALVPPDGYSSRSCTRSFHESRAGGTACAPSSSACVGVGGTDAPDSPPPEPPRGLELPPRCGSCGAATALVMQVRDIWREKHWQNETRDETRNSADFFFDGLSFSNLSVTKKNRSTPRSCRRTRTAPCSSSRALRTATRARGGRKPGSA